MPALSQFYLIFITAMDWVNPLIKINNKFKFQLFGRVFQNLVHLYILIPKYDPQSEGGLTQHSFNLFLNGAGVFLTTQQIRTIKDNFPHQNGINYRFFIDNVRNDITQKRQATIDHTFSQFQTNGKAPLSDLINSLNIDRHPHVRSLTKKAEKAKEDIEAGLRYWSRDGVGLTHQQFIQYCKDVNATIPLQREQFYVDLLIHAFGLFDNGVSFERIKQLEVTVFQKIRERTQIKQDQGWKSSNVFKFLDLQEKGVINYQRFVNVLDRIGCKFIDKECQALFYKHSQGNNLLTYQNLCGLLFHMGSGVKDNKNPVFQLAKSGNGTITNHGMTVRLT